MVSNELLNKIKWYGNYDQGYWDDEEGVYSGNDSAKIKIGDFGNNFQYEAELSNRRQGKYHLLIRYKHDYKTFFDVFSGKFKTKRKAKIKTLKEIQKFENDRSRVMDIWNKVMDNNRRTAIFRRDDFDTNKFEWIASGFIDAGAWDVMGERGMYSSFYSPRYYGLSGYFLSLSKARFDSDKLYTWTMCEGTGSSMSGGGCSKVPINLEELEPVIINCIRNAEFDEKKYKWMMLRQDNYGAKKTTISEPWIVWYGKLRLI